MFPFCSFWNNRIPKNSFCILFNQWKVRLIKQGGLTSLYVCNAGPLSRPMSVPAPNTGLYSGGHHLPSTSRQHEQPNNLGMHGNGGASSSQGGANSGMVSPNSSSGNHQVSSTSPLVIPQPVKIRPPKTYHCRMCDQVNALLVFVSLFCRSLYNC